MRQTLKTTVLNKTGTLHRLTCIFVRRQLNIMTMSVHQTNSEGITEIFLDFEYGTPAELISLVEHMKKQINVLDVIEIPAVEYQMAN